MIGVSTCWTSQRCNFFVPKKTWCGGAECLEKLWNILEQGVSNTHIVRFLELCDRLLCVDASKQKQSCDKKNPLPTAMFLFHRFRGGHGSLLILIIITKFKGRFWIWLRELYSSWRLKSTDCIITPEVQGFSPVPLVNKYWFIKV